MAEGAGPRILPQGRSAAEIWQDASLAAALLAVDPVGCGGIVLRARPGPARTAWLALFAALNGGKAPPLRVPTSIDDDRLLGGLDLGATLAAGRPVTTPGLLRDAQGRGLILPMAERAEPRLAAHIARTLDADGLGPLLILDEGAAPDERPPAALRERCGLAVDLEGLACADLAACDVAPGEVLDARARLASIELPDDILSGLTAAGAALGVGSLRAPLQAVAVARAAAALNGSDEVNALEATAAMRLVLAHRATQLPQVLAEDAEAQEDDPPSPPPEATEPSEQPEAPSDQPQGPLPEDILVEAARAALPPDLLARLLAGSARKAQTGPAGQGAESISFARGRPLPSRPGRRGQGARLDVIATLRTAAPWQGLRKRGDASGREGVVVTPEDFRIRRFRRRRESALIFVVDASGSAAAARLAEAKGAVELMLADAYKRREQVALIAFRGDGAEVFLPLTRSLVQAKRCLQGLPGGGGTPLASGLAAGHLLAEQARSSGMTPFLAILTDGRGNIARDGTAGRGQANSDAMAAARALQGAGFQAVLIDTANRPQPKAAELAEAAGARYVQLPRAGAEGVARLLKAEQT